MVLSKNKTNKHIFEVNKSKHSFFKDKTFKVKLEITAHNKIYKYQHKLN